jgi:hypothetical protein
MTIADLVTPISIKAITYSMRISPDDPLVSSGLSSLGSFLSQVEVQGSYTVFYIQSDPLITIRSIVYYNGKSFHVADIQEYSPGFTAIITEEAGIKSRN